ncbi:hypothetical protein GGS21DRAFT_504307 [Xylaria nigripes]|nr:hypothetical protein GGS21DRAFT_504307 [Xylaria nigripes]
MYCLIASLAAQLAFISTLKWDNRVLCSPNSDFDLFSWRRQGEGDTKIHEYPTCQYSPIVLGFVFPVHTETTSVCR